MRACARKLRQRLRLRHSTSACPFKRAFSYTVLQQITRAHSFPRQILPYSAAPFAKLRGSPRQILGIPRLTAAPILEYTVPTLAQLYTYNFK